MNIIMTLLRIICGILIAIVGCIALLIAGYQLANLNFRFANEGPVVLFGLAFGTGLFWVAWRLIRGRRVHSSITQRKGA